ncbi:hypothetical protein EVA_07480 [gut metagenome]|uniref:Uncharacterized protein n=1 Tax=gut metagenome TaxID=749906 RepID=J9GC30_9ZZZZ
MFYFASLLLQSFHILPTYIAFSMRFLYICFKINSVIPAGYI